MRIYKDCMEAAQEIIRDVIARGRVVHVETVQDKYVGDDPDYETKELLGYVYMIAKTTDKEDMIEWVNKTYGISDLTVEWAGAWFKDRFSLENPEPSYKLREDYWRQFLEPDGKFSYTYGERIATNIGRIIAELRHRNESRQCYLPIFSPGDIGNIGRRRVPCSLGYHFLIRGDELSIIYLQRSCDALKHWAADVYCAIRMQKHVASELSKSDSCIRVGPFIHFISSLHAFKKDVPKDRRW